MSHCKRWSIRNVRALEIMECDGKEIKMQKHRNMEMKRRSDGRIRSQKVQSVTECQKGQKGHENVTGGKYGI